MTDISRNGLGTTSLLLSYASKGNVTAIKELLDAGAAVNASDYDGRTALHLAACEGHLPVAELLLQRGADVNPVDRWGDTVSSPSPSAIFLLIFQFHPPPSLNMPAIARMEMQHTGMFARSHLQAVTLTNFLS